MRVKDFYFHDFTSGDEISDFLNVMQRLDAFLQTVEVVKVEHVVGSYDVNNEELNESFRKTNLCVFVYYNEK